MALKLKKFDAINVIPFIDIMLVLLTIVLTIATFVAQGLIPVNLPDASAKPSANVKMIEISINETGQIFFSKEPVTKEVLRQKLVGMSTSDHVMVRTDKNSKFQSFVDVMDELKNKGLEKVSIVTVTKG